MRTKVKTRARRLLNKANRIPRQGKLWLTRMNRRATGVTKDMDQYVTKKVSRQPYQTIGATLLAGMCIGYLMHR